MNVHYIINETQRVLEQEFFLPFIPEGLVPIAHECPYINDSGKWGTPAYTLIIRWKAQQQLNVCLSETSNHVWLDVDTMFNHSTSSQFGVLTNKLLQKTPLVYQKEFSDNSLFYKSESHLTDVNCGIVAINPSCGYAAAHLENVLKAIKNNRRYHDQQYINYEFNKNKSLLGKLYSHYDLNLVSSVTNHGLTKDTILHHANWTMTMNDKINALNELKTYWNQ